MTLLIFWNCPGGGGGSDGPLRGFDSVYRGDHGWGHSPLLDKSVLMMMLDYDRG